MAPAHQRDGVHRKHIHQMEHGRKVAPYIVPAQVHLCGARDVDAWEGEEMEGRHAGSSMKGVVKEVACRAPAGAHCRQGASPANHLLPRHPHRTFDGPDCMVHNDAVAEQHALGYACGTAGVVQVETILLAAICEHLGANTRQLGASAAASSSARQACLVLECLQGGRSVPALDIDLLRQSLGSRI